MPVFLASRGENFNPGPKTTSFDHSELLCNKVFKCNRNIESFQQKVLEGRAWESTPLLVFSKALYIVSELLIIDKRNTRLAERNAPGSSPITYILREHLQEGSSLSLRYL